MEVPDGQGHLQLAGRRRRRHGVLRLRRSDLLRPRARRNGALDDRHRGDHRLLGPPRRSGPRLLRLRRRHPAGRRRADGADPLDDAGGRSQDDRRLHRLVRGERRHRRRRHALRPQRQLPRLCRRSRHRLAALVVQDARSDLVAARRRRARRGPLRRQQQPAPRPRQEHLPPSPRTAPPTGRWSRSAPWRRARCSRRRRSWWEASTATRGRTRPPTAACSGSSRRATTSTRAPPSSRTGRSCSPPSTGPSTPSAPTTGRCAGPTTPARPSAPPPPSTPTVTSTWAAGTGACTR